MTIRKFISSYACAKFCTCLLVLMGFTLNASAQKKFLDKFLPEDTVALFQGVAVSFDAFGAVQRMVTDYGQYEGAVRVNLRDRYFPVVEIGLGSADHSKDIVTGMAAKTKAPYGRIGCDFNVAKNKHDDYRVLVGFRYGYTSFDFEAERLGVTDPIWGDVFDYHVKENLSFHWVEGLFGVDAKLLGPIRLGWSVRYRLNVAGADPAAGKVWYVPGFGKYGNSTIGGTFNVCVEI